MLCRMIKLTFLKIFPLGLSINCNESVDGWLIGQMYVSNALETYRKFPHTALEILTSIYL